ncbi:MAG: hypothetical protein HRU76_07800 [Phycisphaeraceae bacterium]|nr:hypothetical protein [Phycisphaerales bacterium]QOJ17485.1 MAG: hypothetical protein HRU76_07800 [Phycisphaeraceae bacterium]
MRLVETTVLTKSQLINAIREVNQSAATEWLSRFDVEELREYLDHLQLVIEPRGGHSRWTRRSGHAVAARLMDAE